MSNLGNLGTHLGNGVFATCDGYEIWLCSSNDNGVLTDQIRLDGDAISGLSAYLRYLSEGLRNAGDQHAAGVSDDHGSIANSWDALDREIGGGSVDRQTGERRHQASERQGRQPDHQGQGLHDVRGIKGGWHAFMAWLFGEIEIHNYRSPPREAIDAEPFAYRPNKGDKLYG